MLCVNSSLQELVLSINSMGADGAASVSQALRTNATLRALNLSGNAITAAGAVSVMEALVVNSSLQELQVYHNGIDDELEASLRQISEQRSAPLQLVTRI